METQKKKMTGVQIAAIGILAFIFFDFIRGILHAVNRRQWGALNGKVVTLAILCIIAYLMRDKLKEGWETLKKRRDIAKEEFERKKGDIDIKDAAVFSLSWSREIYNNIPKDRKRLVNSSFILIGIALGIVWVQLDSFSLLTMLLVCALVLAGVNLLIWGVGSEREEKERIRYELETARKMQLSLMPAKSPDITDFDISGCCIPAKDVGGDLFDYVWADKEQKRLCISVVDVSGKGMDAALTAVYTSGALVTEAQHQADVAAVTSNLNSAIYSRRNRSRFVSMLMGMLDISTSTLQYVNAGQSRPLLVHKGKVNVLSGCGPRFPLGVMPAPRYEAAEIKLRPGDALLFYTDGATEAMNANDDMFGDERLQALFLELTHRCHKAVEIVDQLKTEIMNFSGDEHQYDDLTIVVVKAI